MNHLLWIGRRDSIYFRDTWRHCETHFDAVTIRRDAKQAAARRCFTPTVIAVCRDDSRPIATTSIDRLMDRFPDAIGYEFRSPICEGFYRFADRRFAGGMYRWSMAKDVLALAAAPVQSVVDPAIQPDTPAVVNSRAGMAMVVAGRFADAEAVLCQLPEGQPATFCRSFRDATSRSFRGIATIYWDDSVLTVGQTDDIGEKTMMAGRQRFRRDRFDESVRHVWLASEPMPGDLTIARRDGVDTVIQKPGGWKFEHDMNIRAGAGRSPSSRHRDRSHRMMPPAAA